MSEVEALALPEQITACTTLEELGDFLREPDVRHMALVRNAQWTAHRIAYMLTDPADQPKDVVEPAPPMTAELQEASFAELYDPTLPTIVFDANATFSGSELIGVAARKQPVANVVYMLGSDPGEAVTDQEGTTKLSLSNGLLVDAQGMVHYGEFPTPIIADIVDTTDDALLEQCNALGIRTLNSLEVVRSCDSKETLDLVVEGSGVTVPLRHTVQEMWQDNPNAGYVIKPSNCSQGLGVQMFEGDEQKAASEKYHAFLQDNGYEPIIEERIRSYPLYDPLTHKRLDWNVRAIVANGTVIDMYVRASEWGGPVNKSLGARALPITDLEAYGVDSATSAAIQHQLIEAACSAATHIDTAVAGLDITVDESLQAALFEANIGNTGGLQTMATLATGQDAKHYNSLRLLEAWMPDLGATSPIGEIATTQPLTPSFMAAIDAIHACNATKAVAELPIESALQAARTSHTFLAWAHMAHQHLSFMDRDKKAALEQTLCTTYPLEGGRNIARFVFGAANPEVLIEHTQKLEEIIPTSPDWNLLRSVLHAGQKDLAMVRKEITEARNKAASDKLIDTTISIIADTYLTGLITAADEEEDETAHLHVVELFRGFCLDTFDEAQLTAHRIKQQSDSEHMQATVDFTEFAFALVDGRYDAALELCRDLARNEEIDISALSELVRSHQPDMLASAEGLRVALEVDLANEMIVQPITTYLTATMHAEYDLAARYQFAQLIATRMDKDATQDDIMWFSAALTDLADVCRTDDATWQLPPTTNEQGRLQSLGTVLWSHYVGNWDLMNKASAILTDVYGIDADLAILSDIAADGLTIKDLAQDS